MKKSILFAFAVAMFCIPAFATGVRWDLGSPGGAGVATTSGSGLPTLSAVPNATLSFCAYPAVTSGANTPCTNTVTTYTDLGLGTACPANQQVVLQGSTSCQATGDAFGNLGVNLASGGLYTFTLTINGKTTIPYTTQAGGSSGGGGGGGGTITGVTQNGGLVQTGTTIGLPPGITMVPPSASTTANWVQTSTTALTAGSQTTTFLLTPCPAGVDYTSGFGYWVYLNDGAFSEAVSVTAGAAVGPNCTITFTPFFSHPLATSYTIGSASSGIQETINLACGVSATYQFNSLCNVTIPATGYYLTGNTNAFNAYNVYGTIVWHTNQSALNGTGATLACHGRGPCLQVGDQVASTHAVSNTIQGLQFRAPDNNSANAAYNGCAITQTAATGTLATITTASACGLRPGDLVNIGFTDDQAYWGDAIVATASGTSFTFNKNFLSNKSAQSTPGVVALAYEAVLDNGFGTHFSDISYDQGNEVGSFNHFFDFWDDENALVEHFNNNGISLTQNINWTGSFLYSGGGPIGPAGNPGQQWAPVISFRDSTITANSSNGITVYNSNGLYIDNDVIQSTGPWEVYCSNQRGNFQGCTVKDVYNNGSNAGLNPGSPSAPRSPFPGLGGAGLIAGESTGAASFKVSGNGGFSGYFPTGGAGATPYTYYVVANDTTAATQTSPMRILDWLSTGSDSIPVKWPRVANGTDTITYDVIRMTTPVGPTDTTKPYPYAGGCPGGAGGTCGYVAHNLSQAAACSGTLTCTFTDSGSSSTTAYTILTGNYIGVLSFWPGSLVVQGNQTNPGVYVDKEMTPVVAVAAINQQVQLAQECTGYGVATSGGYSTCLTSPTSANNSVKNLPATLLTDGPGGGGGMSLSKGRLNFSTTPTVTLQPHHIITLIDSQPALTQATPTYRPLASTNDCYIGTDVPAAGVALTLGQMSFGCPVAITNYIGQIGDGVTANWLEQLTASLKEFQVPVQLDQSLKIPGAVPGQVLCDQSGTTFTKCTPGIPIDAQTGTSFTIPATDNAHLVTGNNGSATAWTGPTLANNIVFSAFNIGAGLITFTPASGTVNGAGTQIIPQNYFAFHYTDNTNTQMPVMPTIQAFPNCLGAAGSSGQHLNFTAATGVFSCPSGPLVLRVTSDFSTTSTSLATITGLSFTFAANTALNASIDCDLLYTQATAAVADAFGIQDASLAPSNINAQAQVQTNSGGVYAESNLVNLTTTTATNIISFTPSATVTIWNAHLHAMVEQPSGVSSNLNIMALTGNASDAFTVKRGSKCVVNFQ